LPEAKISATVPESMWVHDVSTEYPDTVFRVISAMPGEEFGVGVVEINGDAHEEVVKAISRHDTVSDVEVLWENDEEEKALAQVKTGNHLILLEASRSGVPLETPFEIQDGVGEWELRASRDSLSQLSSLFDSMGVNYTIEYVRDFEEEDSLLTDKQREVVEVADELGYYDTPREASLSDVADELGVAKSTCSEMLHRAEGKVMSGYLGSQS